MIGRYGASVGQIHRGKSGAYNVALIKTIPDVTRLDRDYLYFYLLSPLFQDSLFTVAARSAQAGFSKSDIKDFPLPLPPLPEQKRIVAILDEAFAGIAAAVANTEKNLANARELFDSYLNAVFTQKGEGWSIQTIEDLCTIGDGNHSSKYPKKSEMAPSGVPFIRGTNLVGGKISSSDILFISPEKHQDLKKGHLKTGDVLFTNRGEIGKVAIVDEAFNNANLNSQIAWLRCGENLLPEYLFFFLQSGQAKQHFSQTKSGAALQQFTIKMLKAVEILSPSFPEQKRIVITLNALSVEVTRLQTLYQHKRTTLADLKQSLLHKAFSGALISQSVSVLQEAVA